MMDYKEMAAIVKARVREENERRRIRALRIKRISLAVSGICAVAIVGMGIWSNNDIKNSIPKNDNTITEESEVTTKPTSSVSVTNIITTQNTTRTTAPKTSKTTAVQTQQTTKPQQTVTSKIQTTAVTTTINTPVQTTIIEETTDKPFELVDLGSGLIKPYHAPNNSAVNMPSVLLNGREVRHKNVNNCDDVEICFRVGVMDFGLERFHYVGEYYSMCDEFGLDSYETGTDTKYQYDIDTDTVYSVDITYYRIPDYLGAYYYAVKFPNSEQIHLYRFYKELYYDSEKGEYLEVKDPNESDENTEFFEITHEDENFFKHFEIIELGRHNYKLDGQYCKYSDIPSDAHMGYSFFVNYFRELNQVYTSENCMVFDFEGLENAIVVRFGYDDVCYLYRIAE